MSNRNNSWCHSEVRNNGSICLKGLSLTLNILRWLDETPISRVITRLTQDIQSVDTNLVIYGDGIVSLVIVVTVSLTSAVLFVPIFALPGLFVAALGIYVGSKYLKAQLSVKRELR